MKITIVLLLSLLVSATAQAYDWDNADTDRDGYSVNEGDCDDGNPDVNPGAREDCEDGIDNDCDMTLDMEDPQCTPCGACATTAGPAGPLAPLLLLGVLVSRRRAA